MTKRVVIVIVEGDSDEVLLVGRLKSLFAGCEVRFECQRGDILYDEKSRKAIKETVGDVVKSIVAKRKYKVNDVLAVMHIMDTDGCLIPDEAIKIAPFQGKPTVYKQEFIAVDSERQLKNIVDRNRMRSNNIQRMNSVDTIVGNKYKYQLYYFSRNLEHVIFNEANSERAFKYHNIEAFIHGLQGTIEDYLLGYFPDLSAKAYPERYKESWTRISEGVNSLKRETNVPLLFDFLHVEIRG